MINKFQKTALDCISAGAFYDPFWRKADPSAEGPPFWAEAPIDVPWHLICLSFKGFR
jgi:hypothetical protein